MSYAVLSQAELGGGNRDVLCQIGLLTTRNRSTRNALGVVARAAYKGDSLVTVGIVLEAETLVELTTRYAGMRALLRTSESALGQLAVDRDRTIRPVTDHHTPVASISRVNAPKAIR